MIYLRNRLDISNGKCKPKFGYDKWPKMTKNGQKWPKMAENGQKWPKMAKNGPKWLSNGCGFITVYRSRPFFIVFFQPNTNYFQL